MRILLVAAALFSLSAGAQSPSAAELKKANERFAPTHLAVDLSKLPDNERAALKKLVQAARLMDGLFFRQVWAGNEALLLTLLQDPSPLGAERVRSLLLHKGPWDRLEHNAAFIPGVPPKPAAGNFYPAGATKADVEAWMAKLPEAKKKEATGFFTTIRRDVDGGFIAVPYSVEYQGELAEAAALLREAAALTAQPSLKKYLEARAAAFLSNDYYESDLAWMALDASIEPTIGPYETYEDEWFAAKAGFEAFIALRDDAETAKLQKFSAELQDIENHLPIDPKLRNPKLGASAPIRVVNEIYVSGDANRGVQTAAFNLPNDEKVTKEKGTKRTMLKNVQEAKFKTVLLPISKVALSKADQKNLAFDPFFTHILMHELMHGLGAHNLQKNGKATTVRGELQETYAAIEEAKADISGLWALQYLVDKGVLPKELERTMYTTFLASSFRTIRFGISEAHGKGMALQLNWLLEQGAFTVAKDGTFSVVTAKIKPAVEGLTRELMTLQHEGNKARATELLTKYAVMKPEVAAVLAKLKNVPTDITPRFKTVDELMSQP